MPENGLIIFNTFKIQMIPNSEPMFLDSLYSEVTKHPCSLCLQVRSLIFWLVDEGSCFRMTPHATPQSLSVSVIHHNINQVIHAC